MHTSSFAKRCSKRPPEGEPPARTTQESNQDHGGKPQAQGRGQGVAKYESHRARSAHVITQPRALKLKRWHYVIRAP